jgi:hypothetical protein
MKALHGPEMAKFTVAFVVALVGVFAMRAALQGDRRLVVAGLPAREAVAARLIVLFAAITVAVLVAAISIGFNFSPRSWLPVVGALTLIGLIYGAIGALVGTLLDKLAATYRSSSSSQPTSASSRRRCFTPHPAASHCSCPATGRLGSCSKEHSDPASTPGCRY